MSNVGPHIFLDILERNCALMVVHLHFSIHLSVVHAATGNPHSEVIVFASFFSNHIGQIPCIDRVCWVICLSAMVFVSLFIRRRVPVSDVCSFKRVHFLKVNSISLNYIV